jgi:hypothetical protein
MLIDDVLALLRERSQRIAPEHDTVGLRTRDVVAALNITPSQAVSALHLLYATQRARRIGKTRPFGYSLPPPPAPPLPPGLPRHGAQPTASPLAPCIVVPRLRR